MKINLFPEDLRYSKRNAVGDFNGRFCTYEEIFSEAERFSSVLDERSVVCVLCDDSFETVCFIMEMFIAKQVLLVLSADVDVQLLQRLIKLYSPGYIWMKESMSDNFSLDNFLADMGQQTLNKDSAYQLYCTSFKKYPVHSELALLLSTSGSTGSPKMVRLSYGNLLNNAQIFAKELKFDDACKLAVALPLSHVFPLAFCLIIWYCGGTVYPVNFPVMSNRFARCYSEEGINCFIGVPFTFKMLRKSGFWNEERKERLYFAMSAGARLSSEDQDWLASALKGRFWVGYGQTETAAIVLGTNLLSPGSKPGIIGRPLGDVKPVLSNDQELIIRSKNVCMGYAYEDKDLDKPDENHGSIYTGDLAYIDEEGYVFLKGRNSRFINILGNRTNLDELEILLQEQFPEISLICVGDEDKVFIFSENPEIKRWEKNIRQYLIETQRIPLNMVHCFCIEKIPFVRSGKVDYRKLSEQAGGF